MDLEGLIKGLVCFTFGWSLLWSLSNLRRPNLTAFQRLRSFFVGLAICLAFFLGIALVVQFSSVDQLAKPATPLNPAEVPVAQAPPIVPAAVPDRTPAPTQHPTPVTEAPPTADVPQFGEPTVPPDVVPRDAGLPNVFDSLKQIDALIADGKLGESLDRIQRTQGVIILVGELASDLETPADETQPAPSDLFQKLLRDEKYRSVASALGILRQRIFEQPLRQRIDEIERRLEAKLTQEVQALIDQAGSVQGKAKQEEARFDIFAKYPPSVMPAEFVQQQAKLQEQRRQAAAEKLDKARNALGAGRNSAAVAYLKEVLKQQRYLPHEAGEAQDMLDAMQGKGETQSKKSSKRSR